jgi:hypothetical protein
MSAPSSSPWAHPPSSGDTSGTGASGKDEVRLLLEQLQADRLWLLRQLDGGRWPEWRLDLAALERELGQLLDQASERLET